MNRQDHLKADRMLLGYTDERLHEWLDLTVKYLGSNHRHLRHGIKAIEMAGELFGRSAKRLAILHILIDTRILDRDWIEKAISNSSEMKIKRGEEPMP